MNIFRKCIDLHYVLYIAYLYLKYLFDVFDNCRLEKNMKYITGTDVSIYFS